MKAFKYLVLLVILLAGVLAAPLYTIRALDGTGDTKLDAMLTAMIKAAAILSEKDYAIVDMTIDKRFKDEAFDTSRNLYAGNEYVIVGVGSENIATLTIQLLDEDKVKVDEDNTGGSTPVVTVSPKKDGRYFFSTTITALTKGADEEKSYFFGYIIAFKKAS
jgi:hypothetical protein